MMLTDAFTSVLLRAADAVALAQGAGAVPEKASGGLPQFDPAVFAPQIIWLVITFAVFYYIMSKMVLPKIGDVLEDREERIQDDLDQADQLSQEAESVQGDFEDALTGARSTSVGLIAKARGEAQDKLNAKAKAVEADLDAQAQAAEERISAAKTKAFAELEDVAAEACNDIVSKLLGKAPTTANVTKAVKAELSRRGA